MRLYQRKTSKPISPLQRWTRRRNWEKNQLNYFHKELTFRLNARWMASDLRSQTQTNDEIEKLRKITVLMEYLLSNWKDNTTKSRLSINFHNYK